MGTKIDTLRKMLRITQGFFFSQQFWKEENPEEYFDFIETTIFGQTSERDEYSQKLFSPSKCVTYSK